MKKLLLLLLLIPVLSFSQTNKDLNFTFKSRASDLIGPLLPLIPLGVYRSFQKFGYEYQIEIQYWASNGTMKTSRYNYNPRGSYGNVNNVNPNYIVWGGPQKIGEAPNVKKHSLYISDLSLLLSVTCSVYVWSPHENNQHVHLAFIDTWSFPATSFETWVSPAVSDGLYVGSSCTATVNGNSSSFTLDHCLYTLIRKEVVDRPIIDIKPSNIYPNPTTNNVTIDTEVENPTTQVYDANGNMIINTTEKTVNLSSYPTGTYIFNVNGEAKKVFKK